MTSGVLASQLKASNFSDAHPLAAIGDVNDDGIADIAVSSPDDNTIALFLMNRGETTASGAAIAVGWRPKGLAIRDPNGDGKAEMAITTNADNTVTMILGTRKKVAN